MAATEIERFTATPDTLAHVLRDQPLRVPIYQRSYSWTPEQVGQFWSDLKAAMSVPDPEYFVGTFVLSSSTDQRLTIIDGQQRLATTAILIAAMRNFLVEVKDKTRRLETRKRLPVVRRS